VNDTSFRGHDFNNFKVANQRKSQLEDLKHVGKMTFWKI